MGNLIKFNNFVLCILNKNYNILVDWLFKQVFIDTDFIDLRYLCNHTSFVNYKNVVDTVKVVNAAATSISWIWILLSQGIS